MMERLPMARVPMAHDLRFRSADGTFTVHLHGDAIAQMLQACRSARSVETGGILIGHYSRDRRTAEVAIATGPGRDSRAGGTWLVRGIKGLQSVLDHLWSRRAGYYLGEWHFHPGALPEPSGQDVSQMKSIAGSTRYNCPEPVLIILGGDPFEQYTLHVEVNTRARQRILLLMEAAHASSTGLLQSTWKA